MSEIFTNIPEIRYEGPDSKNAFGLLKAAAIIEDGRIEGFVEKKYESFNSELGQKIRNGEATLTELAEKASELKNVKTPISGNQEYLEGVFNNILLSGF
ncbi:xylose isomerase [Lachnospiraceae bacterium G41]|nr:xylose isomerase [Lachnospiraceae bacterium G41]